MHRLLWLCLLLVAPLASAQEFPAPGEGVFTWEPVTDRPLKAYALAFNSTGQLYAAKETLYVYEPAPTGPPAGRWRRLGYPRLEMKAVLPLDPTGDTILVGRANTGFLSRSTDGGATWTDVNGCSSCGGGDAPNRPGGFLVLPAGHPHAGRILAGTLQYSDDRGATWTDSGWPPRQLSSAHVFALLPSGRVLMGGTWGVAASDDGGTSYAVTPLYGEYHYQPDGLAAVATPGSVQAGAPACGLPDGALCEGTVAVSIDATRPDVQAFWTNDGGRSWSSGFALPEPSDGIGNGFVAGVVAAGVEPATGLGRAIAVLGRGLVYGTRDGGQTWEVLGRMPLDISEGNHWVRYVLLGPDGHLWVGTFRAGPRYDNAFVFRSAESVAEAYPVASAAGPAAGGARLEVRPNPAVGAVTVRLLLDAPTPSAALGVYDALGRRVARLHDGPLAAGRHAFSFETARLAPGVYVVQVRVTPTAGAAWTEVRRLTVAR